MVKYHPLGRKKEHQSKFSFSWCIFLVSLCLTVGVLIHFLDKNKTAETTSFENVLLSVKINYHRELAVLQKYHSFWSPFFPNICFCGWWNQSELHEFRNENFCVINSRNEGSTGADAAICLKEMMKKFTEHDHFLYAHDDMMLNLSQITKLPLNISWFTHELEPHQPISLKSSRWVWWDHTLPHMRNIWKKLPESEFFKSMEFCAPQADLTWPHGQSDIAFITKKDVGIFVKYVEFIEYTDIFHEVAFPTFSKCILKNQFLPLKLCTNYQMGRRFEWENWIGACGEQIDVLHPMKINEDRYKYGYWFRYFNEDYMIENKIDVEL